MKQASLHNMWLSYKTRTAEVFSLTMYVGMICLPELVTPHEGCDDIVNDTSFVEAFQPAAVLC